jgi:hypothetical protein
MTTQPQNSRFKFSVKSMLILSVVILFSCSYSLMAQQKDGEETNSSSNSSTNTAPSRPAVNFNILTLLDGEYLEMFGANNSRGILRGHPAIPGAELGTTTADPLIFSTNGIERMRIGPDGSFNIGTTLTGQNAPFDFHTSSTATYVPGGNSPARLRLINTASTLNNVMEINLGSGDTAGGVTTRVKLASIATNQTPGATSGDFVIGLRNAGALFESTRFVSNGRVGVGTATPTQKLDVQGGAINASGGLCIAGDCKTAWSQVGGGSSQWTTAGTSIFYNTGNVGVGTNAPGAKLQVLGLAPGGTAAFTGTSFSSHFNFNADGSEDTYIRGGKASSRVIINEVSTGAVIITLGGGSVGIGTATPTAKLHVQGAGRITGNLTVDGNIAAKYQDLAEWVPAAEQLTAGTVVVLDSSKSNQVISSSKTYDTSVAGVISAQPGITLGEKSDEKVLVATTGRVLVNVDATNGPIQIGDLLVTSDREGFAMKSLPVEIGGARLHRPGTLIGKALEPLAGGTGKILVLLSLQ